MLVIERVWETGVELPAGALIASEAGVTVTGSATTKVTVTGTTKLPEATETVPL